LPHAHACGDPVMPWLWLAFIWDPSVMMGHGRQLRSSYLSSSGFGLAQVKEMVFSTFRGRHMLEHLKQLRHAVHDSSGRRRLNQVGADGRPEFLDKLSEDTVGTECFTKDIPYRGTVSVDEYNSLCEPWSEEEIAQYSNVLDSNTPAHCRQLDPNKRPRCPIVYGGVRQLSTCRIDHCAELLYYFDSKADSRALFPNKTWGLDRIQSRLPTYDFNHDPNDLGGQGVHCYIVDSGVNLQHQEFTNTYAQKIIVVISTSRVQQLQYFDWV